MKLTKSIFLAALIAFSFLTAATDTLAAQTVDGCITSNPLNNAGTRTKVIPFGCSASISAPFTYTSVLNSESASLSTLTINAFEQFASKNGVGGVFIAGTIDDVPFSGIGQEVHLDNTFNKIAQLGVSYQWTLTSATITPITLPLNLMFQLDASKPSGGTLLVTAFGNPVNGIQNYLVSNNFNVYIEASLNGGESYTSIDPAFILSTFDEASANPEIKAFIAASIPEPETYAMLLSGLVAIGLTARRKSLKGDKK